MANRVKDLQYQQLKTGVTLTLVDDPVEPGAAANVNLFVVSNIFGYFVAGSSDSFVFDSLTALRSAFENGEPEEENKFTARTKVRVSNAALRFIRLSADERTVVVALEGGHIYLYSLSNLISNPTKATPDSKLTLDSEILDIRPNPSVERNRTAAILLVNGKILLINMDGSSTVTLDKAIYTAMAWSTKGKQIMCGTDTGALHQIDPEGVLKKQHKANPANEDQLVVGINWIETAVFIVVYCPQPEDDGENIYEFNVCLISKENPAEPRYLSFSDLCFPMMNPDAGLTYYMTPSIKLWGGNIKDLINVTSSPSADVGVIGRAADGSWEKWDLEDTQRAAVPGVDSLCVGTALDLTSEDTLMPLDEEGPKIQPVPIIYIYSHLGVLAAYHIINLETAKDGRPCPVMVKAQSLPQAGVKAKKLTPGAPTATLTAALSTTTATPSAKPFSSVLPSAPSLKTTAPTPSFATPANPFKASPAAPPSATPMSLQSKTSVASKGMFGGSPTSFSSAPVLSVAPNPVVNPNPSFQQGKPMMVKQQQPGAMQRLLQEPDVPVKVIRKKTDDGETSVAPAPKVSEAMDALSRQLENAYFAMTEELKTLHSHVRETEELVKAREHIFVELDQFMAVTNKRIKHAKETRAVAETVLADFVQLRADLIKVASKRDEIGRLLRVRQDPLSDENVHSMQLNPADLNQQRRIKNSFEVVDSHLRGLEDYVEALNVKASRMRNGHDTEGPTLDSIRRSVRNISSTLLQRQGDLDEISSELDRLGIAESLNPVTDKIKQKKSAASNPQKNSRLSQSYAGHSQHLSSIHAKENFALQLKRVFTSNPRARSIYTTLTLSTTYEPLSLLPKTEKAFVPASEPRRVESKKRLSAVVPSQSDNSAVSSTPGFIFAKMTPNTGLSPAPMFGLGFGSSPFSSSTTSTFAGFQVPQSTAATPATPASSAPAWTVPKSSDQPRGLTPFQTRTTEIPNLFSTAQPTSASTFSFAKQTPMAPKEEVQEQDAHEQEADEQDADEQDADEQDADEQDEEFEDVEYEYDEEERSHRRRVRYTHDGREYEVEEGSEPPTEGSDTDQRDIDQEEQEEQEEQGEQEEDVEKGAEPEVDEGIGAPKADQEEQPRRDEWAAPGFQFPAVAPTLASSTSTNSAFAFFTAPATSRVTKESSDATNPQAPQTLFATSGNAFGSTTPFTFGKPLPSTSSLAASVTTPLSSEDKTPALGKAEPAIALPAKTPTPVAVTLTPREEQPVDSGDEGEEQADNENDAQSEAGVDQEAYRDEGQSEDEQDQEAGEEEDDDKGSVLAEEKEQQDSDEDEQGQEQGDQENDESDKESALTAVRLSGGIVPPPNLSEKDRSSTTSGESFSLVENAPTLEFSKAGLGSAGPEKGGGTASPASSSSGPTPTPTLTSGTALAFGNTPAFASAAELKSPKGGGMSFVKLPRARRESRDSLDSNTSDDEVENVMSDDGGSPVLRGRDTQTSSITGFGKPLLNTQSGAGGLESFTLSLGSDMTSKKESSAW
ncbi:hypothetical protein BGZ65_009488, partial [Modicella reniformis]